MAKIKNILVCTGITTLFWVLTRLAPSLILSLIPLGSHADTLLFLLFLPIGYAVSRSVSRRKYPSCIRVNLYILATIEIFGVLSTLLYLISDLAISTGQYSANSFGVLYSDYLAVYLPAITLEVIYIGLSFFLAKATIPNASQSDKPQPAEDAPVIPLPKQQAEPFSPPELSSVISSPDQQADTSTPLAPPLEAPPPKPTPKRRPKLLAIISVLLAIALLVSVGFNIYLFGNYERGYNDGDIAGFERGYDSGFNRGNADGYVLGLKEGICAGLTTENLAATYDDYLSCNSAIPFSAWLSAGRIGYADGYSAGYIAIKSPGASTVISQDNVDFEAWSKISSLSLSRYLESEETFTVSFSDWDSIYQAKFYEGQLAGYASALSESYD